MSHTQIAVEQPWWERRDISLAFIWEELTAGLGAPSPTPETRSKIANLLRDMLARS